MSKPINIGNVEVRRPDGDVVARFSTFRQAVATLIALEAGVFDLFEAVKGGKRPQFVYCATYEAV